MLTEVDVRWNSDMNSELPQRIGILDDIDNIYVQMLELKLWFQIFIFVYRRYQ